MMIFMGFLNDFMYSIAENPSAVDNFVMRGTVIFYPPPKCSLYWDLIFLFFFLGISRRSGNKCNHILYIPKNYAKKM